MIVEGSKLNGALARKKEEQASGSMVEELVARTNRQADSAETALQKPR
jgi:hypothetical protein